MASLAPRARRTLVAPASVGGGLLLFLLTQYAGALSIPFINDDYVDPH